jgi:hypothetical protein|tara:strand:- start:149 stop:418 length:270 start_codon:yes stop_codon:yes gene_type:complete
MGKMSQIHAAAQDHVSLHPGISEDDPKYAEAVETVAGELLVLHAEQARLEKMLVRIEYGDDFAYSTQRKEIAQIERALQSVKKELAHFG